MNTETFEDLLQHVTPRLRKIIATIRKPLSAREILACTLRFIATGESYASLQYQFRISNIEYHFDTFPQVYEAIYEIN